MWYPVPGTITGAETLAMSKIETNYYSPEAYIPVKGNQ